MDKYELFLPKGGNHLPFTPEAGNLTLYLEDQKHPIYKRLGGFNLFRKVYKVNNKIEFLHLDGKSYYFITEKSGVLRIDGLGLPDTNKQKGDLFLEITNNAKYMDKTNDVKLINTKDTRIFEIEDLLEICLSLAK